MAHVLITETQDERLTWNVERLWELARDLPVETVPLLSLPIILTADGSLMDGMPRIAKAWVLGLKEIQVVRFPVTPEPDERVPKTVSDMPGPQDV
jgi:hypothetical protein